MGASARADGRVQQLRNITGRRQDRARGVYVPGCPPRPEGCCTDHETSRKVLTSKIELGPFPRKKRRTSRGWVGGRLSRSPRERRAEAARALPGVAFDASRARRCATSRSTCRPTARESARTCEMNRSASVRDACRGWAAAGLPAARAAFECVYGLLSITHAARFTLKVRRDRGAAARCQRLRRWPTANWHERERRLLWHHVTGHPT